MKTTRANAQQSAPNGNGHECQRKKTRHVHRATMRAHSSLRRTGLVLRLVLCDEIRSHFGSRTISCPNVQGDFPVHEPFWLFPVQVSTNQFCCFPPVLKARASDGTDVSVSLLPASCSNVVLLTALFLTSKGTRYRASTMHHKINEMFVQVAKLQLLKQSVSRFEDFVQTLSQTMAS